MESEEQAPKPSGGFGFKKRRQGGNIRKRSADDDDSEAAEGSAVVREKKVKKESVTTFSTARKGEKEAYRFTYESSQKIQTRDDQGATRELQTETEKDRDGRALREQVLAQATDGAEPADPTVYKGMNNYKDYRAAFRRENTIAAEKGTGAHGPLRANTTMRGTFIMDYKPDLCKDYKETGYCGYGDSCKFMHDRGDYKSGWELDRDWEEQEKARKAREALKLVGEEEESEEEEDEVPFACFLCRQHFAEVSDPVVTKCKHYFCEHCALKHHAKTKKCFVCNEPTGGVFNVAQDILAKFRNSAGAGGSKGAAADGDDDDDDLGGEAPDATPSHRATQGWVMP